jgi:hypothetical protein
VGLFASVARGWVAVDVEDLVAGALRHEVTEEDLTEYIKTLAFAHNVMIREKFVQNRLSALADAVREWKDNVVASWHKSPVPGT